MTKTKKDAVLEKLRQMGVLRAKDIRDMGLSREYMRKLVDRGVIVRLARGLYGPPDAEISATHSIAEACKRIPKGTICLLSALRFHEMTTQSPHEVWIAIGRKMWRPKTDGMAIRIVRFSGHALVAGAEEHQVEGVAVKVYNPAKTVADCFKYRNKIGLDVALEALREGWRERRFSMDELWRFAKICRVANVMRPYLESLTS